VDPTLVKTLGIATPETKAVVFDVLARRAAKQAVPSALESLRDPAADVRRAAAGLLAALADETALEGLVGALTGSAAPAIVPSLIPRAGAATAPGSRIVVGMVGIGDQGGRLLTTLLGRRGVQVAAVCDVDRRFCDQARQKVESAYGAHRRSGRYTGCAAHGDFRDLVTRPDIDAVVVATPDHWHALMSVWACRHGKDVYCEKPLTLTVGEGQAMVTAARRYGCVVQAGTMQRSSPAYRRACELVRSGRIGRLLSVQVSPHGYGTSRLHYGRPLPAPEWLDWDMWLGPAPWRPYQEGLHPMGYRKDRDFSGGRMTDYGHHDYDIAQWGIGAEASGPVEIVPPRTRDERLTWRYANGVRITNGGARLGWVTFTGTDGRVGCGRWFVRTDPPELAREPLRPDDVHLHASDDHIGDFLACVRTRARPVADVAASHRSVSICHLGNIALRLNRPLKWNPDQERFVGDAEADRLLSRPMREPWRL
jgi:predicted dehydrogenase